MQHGCSDEEPTFVPETLMRAFVEVYGAAHAVAAIAGILLQDTRPTRRDGARLSARESLAFGHQLDTLADAMADAGF